MLLIIQIPCWNEEGSLKETLAQLPRQLPGVDRIEWLVIDDGSTDRTLEVARACGVDHTVPLGRHRGLAFGFVAGIRRCVELGADIIVNTDADNQYCAQDIVHLVQPILEGKAEMVVGARPISEMEEFSPLKKRLQQLGSWIMRHASQTDVPDAPSGFRALSRSAAQRISVFSKYSYTMETLIQAGQKNLAVTWVPVHVNKVMRPSRLFTSIGAYVRKSGLTILRIFIVYRPFRFFGTLSGCIGLLGALIFLRYLYFFVTGHGQGYVQSLLLGVLLVMLSGMVLIAGLLADLTSVNRQLLEDQKYEMALLREEVRRLGNG
jgi:glycosyltransferase involved in cell wall biosynthesis